MSSTTSSAESQRSILFLKSKANTLTGPEGFLKNRGWLVRSFVDMRDAIQSVMQSQPNYILICADHPNAQVLMLPQLFQGKLGIHTIAYFDKHPTQPKTILDAMKTPYVLYPNVSGPSVERMILKIQRDLQVVEERKREFAARGEVPNDLIKIKQGTAAEEDSTTHRFAMKELEDMLASVDPATQSKSDLIFLERNLGEMHSAETDEAKHRGLKAVEPGTSAGKRSLKNADPASGSNHRPEKDFSSGPELIKRRDKPVETGADAARTTKNSEYSVIGQGAQFAVRDVSAPEYTEDITVFENGLRVACIVIQSVRFSGYLIAALGKNRVIDAKFLKTISSRLAAFLKANGEKIQERENMDLVLQSVRFDSWSESQAEFIRKAPHGDDEMTMAFFPFRDIDIKTQEARASEMCTINIDDLADNAVLDFDLYLNLPVNNRNILYTPRGHSFYGSQKERLKKSGVLRMSVFKSDVPQLASYRAKNYLNSRIEDFNSDKKNES